MKALELHLGKSLNSCIPVYSCEAKIKDVLLSLKEASIKHKELIYVTDEVGRFQGVVSLADAFFMEENNLLANIIRKNYPKVISGTSEESIANTALRNKVTSIPVIDHEGKLLNVITSDSIMNILRKEHIEDLHKMAGIRKENKFAKDALEAVPLRRAKNRLPWLLVGLGGSILATGIMAKFESLLSANIAVSFFIPGIVYIADAIGTQTEAISVRGLSLSDISFKKLFVLEMRTGMMIGLVLSIVCFPFVTFFFTINLAIAVSVAVFVAGTMAASIGLLFPWGLSKLKIDPAFGSGPLATIIQDVLSILIYFLIVNGILKFASFDFSIYTFF